MESPRDAIEAGIGYVPEDRLSEGLFLPRSIADNIVISEIDRLTGALSVLDFKRYRQEVEEWVRALSIATPDPENACSTLSGGNQQRVVLAKWLACKPDVLVLNRNGGGGHRLKHDIHRILRRLPIGHGGDHHLDDLPEVLQNCSHLLIMKDGRIVARPDPRSTDEHRAFRTCCKGGEHMKRNSKAHQPDRVLYRAGFLASACSSSCAPGSSLRPTTSWTS